MKTKMKRTILPFLAAAAFAAAGCSTTSSQQPAQQSPAHQTTAGGAEGMHHGGMHHGAMHKEGVQGGDAAVPMAFDQPPAVGTRARCPVSKEVFSVAEGTPRATHGGKHYAFCCAGCKPKFEAAPEKHLTSPQGGM